MKKLMKKRAGFTLVELLIVIIIIGILAGAMLLVAGSGTDKAEATKIVSDLRSLKAAALMYYADHPSFGTAPDIASLDIYMDKKSTTAGYDYLIDSTTTAGSWFVGKPLTGDKYNGVKIKLQDMAAESRLIEGTATAVTSGDYKGGNGVWMIAR